MNTKFNLSVSVEYYADKNTTPWNSVEYRPQELTIDRFIELVRQGYCFCHCFRHSGKNLIQTEKNKENFQSAQIVFVDIDNVPITMKEFVSTLSQKPTVAYTTRNNHTKECNYLYRFRLCYLFDTPITTEREYLRTYDGILQSIRTDIPTLKRGGNKGKTEENGEDTHLRSVSQQIAGNAESNIEVVRHNTIFSLSDFPFENNNVSFSSFYKSETEKPIQRPKTVKIVDNEFITDFNTLKPLDLIDKYQNRYPYFDRTPLHYENGFAIIPEDYIEIYRKWYRDPFEKTNGDIIYRSAIKKLKDGERRRFTLFIAGLIMKKIMPTITYEHLLLNLIREKTGYYYNLDNVLTNKVISDIAKNVINTPIEEIRLQSRHKKKFVIDKAYCAKHGISPNAMKNIIRKKLKDEEIGNVYDISLSVSENLSNLKQLGMKIGKTKLYAWCAENGISTKGHNTTTTAFKFLSNFSKSHLTVIEKIIGTTHRYFIADDIHEKEILKSQYHDLLKAIPEVA